jgi:hypothetical protein
MRFEGEGHWAPQQDTGGTTYKRRSLYYFSNPSHPVFLERTMMICDVEIGNDKQVFFSQLIKSHLTLALLLSHLCFQ